MEDTDILGYVRERLPAPEDKEKLEAIAQGSGVSVHTLRKIASGETSDPRVSTVQELAKYFRDLELKAA